MSGTVSIKTSLELEVKRLTAENGRLRDELKQGQIDGVKDSEDVRFKLNSEQHEKIEALKKAHAQTLETYEEQLRKLRHIV